MYKWLAGSTSAAAVLSLAVASAQTYPQTSDSQPRTKSTTRSSTTDKTASAQRVTMTGCLMHGTGAQSAAWMLSNATSATNTSRSGSPSNEGTSASNRNGTEAAGVSGSTSTAIGTSGTNIPGGSIDTEAHGGGTLGATDQRGSTVGAGVTVGATTDESASTAKTDESASTANSAQNTGAEVSYQLMGVRNPTQYANKRVEVVGTMSSTGNSSNRMLHVTTVRVLGDTCQ
jgi:hypothetical protein